MLPLVVAPRGGTLPGGITVQRSLGATRSVEFDAVLMGGCPLPAADAVASRDSKAAELEDRAEGVSVDPRVQLLLQECFRHAKAIGAWGAGADALVAAGLTTDAPGVVVDDEPADVLAAVQELMGAHRVWDRFDATLA
jgi:catalase